MPTIRDLSEYTGLAFGTVSKYLNGGNVRPENRVMLDEAVSKLHYRMNFAARTLKRQRSNTIGVVLPAASLAGMGGMLTALDRTLLLNGGPVQARSRSSGISRMSSRRAGVRAASSRWRAATST